MSELKEPKGIGFFSVKTGETHYAKREAQIQAYINSSNMGINASRGQDFGWRLAPEWVRKVKAFRNDDVKMEVLAAKTDGRNVTEVQILYYMYGQELRAFHQKKDDSSSPYEEQYLQDISSQPKGNVTPPEEVTLTPEELKQQKQAKAAKKKMEKEKAEMAAKAEQDRKDEEELEKLQKEDDAEKAALEAKKKEEAAKNQNK